MFIECLIEYFFCMVLGTLLGVTTAKIWGMKDKILIFALCITYMSCINILTC